MIPLARLSLLFAGAALLAGCRRLDGHPAWRECEFHLRQFHEGGRAPEYGMKIDSIRVRPRSCHEADGFVSFECEATVTWAADPLAQRGPFFYGRPQLPPDRTLRYRHRVRLRQEKGEWKVASWNGTRSW